MANIRVWTLEKCKMDALQYKSKKEWREDSVDGYNAAVRYSWMGECSKHMIELVKPRGYWTLERCKEEALKYKTRNQWDLIRRSGYRIALKNGWLDECCKHMLVNSGVSKPEDELLTIIKSKFPSAKSTYFKADKNVFHQYRFQIDIFVKELDRGIEFNSIYWHKTNLKRDWTIDSNKYHETKKAFFNSIGKQYIEIWYEDWLINKQNCIDKCFQFLENSHD